MRNLKDIILERLKVGKSNNVLYPVPYKEIESILKFYCNSIADDDDAFDFIIEHIANALENVDEDFLSGAVETYFDLHDKIMDELGLVSWE